MSRAAGHTDRKFELRPTCSIPSVIAKKKAATNLRLVAAPFVVPLTGIEPVRCCHRGILSPLRLPVSPQRRNDLR